ncbi:Elongator complex subunit Elp2 [Schizosaccharomyces pombe]
MFQYEALHVGCNRIPTAATWSSNLGLIYGAERLIAVADPFKEINYLMAGHSGRINCVCELATNSEHRSPFILSGASDKTLRLWQLEEGYFTCIKTIELEATVNCLCVNENLVVCGCSNSSCIVYSWNAEQRNLTEISRFTCSEIIPLEFAIVKLDHGIILTVCGSSKKIMVYGSDSAISSFKLKAVLRGHLDWVRTLSFRKTSGSTATLASGSQDRYIRLWNISLWGSEDEKVSEEFFESVLSNKPVRFTLGKIDLKIVFDALLMGHEDWVMSVDWHPTMEMILSSSADSSMIVWEPDTNTGIWVVTGRMGEIASSHGSTTATGSAGGFWGGLWNPNGNCVVCWGRTGGWRLWKQDAGQWLQLPSISGHTKSVKGVAWDPEGKFYLSAGTDQTTRLFARFKKDNAWHEMARPQIHGYDLTSISCMPSRIGFLSCADEKVSRVFKFPKTIVRLLYRLCDTNIEEESLPDAANVPLLGLSNKATTASETGTVNAEEVQTPVADVIDSLNHPPFEEHLQRLLLFPEVEKLFGHGYEVYACAISNNGNIAATSCKSQTPEHAVIRLYETQSWNQQQVLKGHSLTVTTIKFSPDDRYILSAGRDRLVCLHEQAENLLDYNNFASIKAHSRIIWDASWAPKEMGYFFATASRDKFVKFWKINDNKKICDVAALQFSDAVTAVDFAPFFHNDELLLAVGTEAGKIFIWRCPRENLTKWYPTRLPDHMAPMESINQILWKPTFETMGLYSLLIAGEDTSVRLLNVTLG